MTSVRVKGEDLQFDDIPGPAGAPTIVWAHGFLLSAKFYRALADRLTTYRHIVPDLRAHGRSSGLADDATLARMAEDTWAITASLGIDSFFLVGHSMGNAVAVRLAANHPTAVLAGVSLAGIPVTGKRDDAREAVSGMIAIAGNSSELAAALAGLFVHENPDAPLVKSAGEEASRVPRAAVETIVTREFFLDESHRILPRLTQPWLFLVPGADAAEPPEYQISQAQLFANAEVRILEGEGHMVPQERPDLVAQHIGNFLNDLEPGLTPTGRRDLFVARSAMPQALRQPNDPMRDLRSDPRVIPRLVTALAAFGLDTAAGPPSIDRHASHEILMASVAEQHAGFGGLYEALPNTLSGDDAVEVIESSETIVGIDGNDIALRIYRPPVQQGPLPCIVYVHGGGMTILDSFNKVHRQWCGDLASTGMVVIGVDFRNAYTATGPHPFPAGLNDCTTAVTWIHDHRQDLGISRIILQGESGGANLVLATTLKAKQDAFLDAIDGVYASVPYISGVYGTWNDSQKLMELPSLHENDGCFMNCAAMDLLVLAYDPTSANATNPLCWPYFASVADLEGLPPHAISVNELDPLRDEGAAYFRRLVRAGVPATCQMNYGLTHAAELIFRQALPESYWAAIGDICSFVRTVERGVAPY